MLIVIRDLAMGDQPHGKPHDFCSLRLRNILTNGRCVEELLAMSRKTFFSFHYSRDLWRVNQIRNSHVVEGVAAAGFSDASLWEEAKKKGDAEIKKMIDAGLVGTSVTVVLIGAETANRKYVAYEIEKSISRGNGIIGVRIHGIKDQNGRTDYPGNIPQALIDAKAPIYTYEYGKLGDWIEAAYNTAKK